MAKRNNRTGRYEVLIDFTEPQDDMTIYRAGKDKYPRAGYNPTEERIAYLQSDKNALGRPSHRKTLIMGAAVFRVTGWPPRTNF